MSIGSGFLKALNAGDETSGHVSYTSVYALINDIVFPQLPQSVFAQGDGATNVPIQSICLVRVVDHIQALADAVAYAVVVDAFAHPGPADPSRINRSVCGQLFLPGVTVDSFALHFATIYAAFVPDVAGLTRPLVSSEPPAALLRPTGSLLPVARSHPRARTRSGLLRTVERRLICG